MATAVRGTSTVFLRPLRHLLDVETTVSVLLNAPAATRGYGNDEDDVLGYVHVQIALAPQGPATFARPSTPRFSEDDAVEEPNAKAEDTLRAYIGRHVWIRVRMQIEPMHGTHQRGCKDLDEDPECDNNSAGSELPSLSVMQVKYQFSRAAKRVQLPVEHTNLFPMLVTDDLVAYVSSHALEFEFVLEPASAKLMELVAPSSSPAPSAMTDASETNPSSRSAEAKAAMEAAEAATAAARAAREAAMAAASALDAANASIAQAKQERETWSDRTATAELLPQSHAPEARHKSTIEVVALEKDRLRDLQEHQMKGATDEKQRLRDRNARLEAELHDKQTQLDTWKKEQAVSTDKAVELLKQRMLNDAQERDELQRRLKTLEEEKLALLAAPKSKACVLQ